MKEVAQCPNDQPWNFPVECQGTMPLRKFGESEEAN